MSPVVPSVRWYERLLHKLFGVLPARVVEDRLAAFGREYPPAFGCVLPHSASGALVSAVPMKVWYALPLDVQLALLAVDDHLTGRYGIERLLVRLDEVRRAQDALDAFLDAEIPRTTKRPPPAPPVTLPPSDRR